MVDDADQTIAYMQHVIAWQPRLYAFALSLTGNPNEADDVVQNANLALLQKQEAFRADADFGAWAM
ncbi:MAG: sigma factor, partial [Thermoguttaceae bacterium]